MADDRLVSHQLEHCLVLIFTSKQALGDTLFAVEPYNAHACWGCRWKGIGGGEWKGCRCGIKRGPQHQGTLTSSFFDPTGPHFFVARSVDFHSISPCPVSILRSFSLAPHPTDRSRSQIPQRPIHSLYQKMTALPTISKTTQYHPPSPFNLPPASP